MSAPRGLSPEEAEAWDRLASTVEPLHPVARKPAPRQDPPAGAPNPPVRPSKPQGGRGPAAKPRFPTAPIAPKRVATPSRGGLDSHWDRRLKAGAISPDFTLDLHGHGLDAAYDRLLSGIAQARAMGARTILLVAGKSRPVDPADRGARRGAIRAKLLDWLAASEHHSAIAAVRRAHIRHGGEGALYIVLRRGD